MKCNYCEFRCDLSKSEGICGRYTLKDGAVCEKEPMKFLSHIEYKIEEMPFFHAYPDTITSQFGTVGCNAGCDYCLNSHVAMVKDSTVLTEYTPEQLVKEVIDSEAQSIVFGINEVTCFMQSALKVAEVAHKAGLKVGCMTNGFQTEESAELLAENMDMINVSLKSMDDEFYRKHLKLSSAQPVMRNVKIFAKKSHVEVSTPLDEELSREKLMEMARFLADIDKNIPWHLLRLQLANERTVAQNERNHMPDVLKTMDEIKEFLPFVYLGNLAGSRWVDTICPECKTLLIKRMCISSCGSKLRSIHYEGKTCPGCGAEIPILI